MYTWDSDAAPTLAALDSLKKKRKVHLAADKIQKKKNPVKIPSVFTYRAGFLLSKWAQRVLQRWGQIIGLWSDLNIYFNSISTGDTLNLPLTHLWDGCDVWPTFSSGQ